MITNKNIIKLYHYSNDNFDIIKPCNFGKNNFTFNDVKACKVDRAFFYLNDEPIEYQFKNTKYVYITLIDKNYLYDLRTDKDDLKNLYKNDIEGLLLYCKRHYNGIIYDVGFTIACIFYDIKAIQVIRR